MKFLLDQDVYATTGRFLSSLGHDVLSVSQIGIDAMRRDCSHFAKWLRMLELVGSDEVK